MRGAPRVSIVVPFHDYDVTQQARELCALATRAGSGLCEVIYADDASHERRHGRELQAVLDAAQCPALQLRFEQNLGRAAIRNRLAVAARGAFLLYLDADMLPDRADFLDAYLSYTHGPTITAVCGGRSYTRLGRCPPEAALYHYFSQRTECVAAETRQTLARLYLLTNNLLVDRQAMLAHPFDERYVGWGFEDFDWSLRLPDTARIAHIDNPATHMGVLSERELLSKYASSQQNFLHLYRAHGAALDTLALVRVSRRMARLPLPLTLCNRLARSALQWRWLPLLLRFYGIQLYRASLYAISLQQKGHHVAIPG
ncbi:MAG TPA: glycosyltransferase [Solimonas sp.]|nr:glycosyltransferase [Solimonas sp.]